MSCGRTVNCIALKSGIVYSWGKFQHEKPNFNDNIKLSVPSLLIEDKYITFLSCGLTHVMALDNKGKIYGWGEGDQGCLGYGDGKKRIGITQIPFFNKQRVIDVSCGEKFTVVIVAGKKPP